MRKAVRFSPADRGDAAGLPIECGIVTGRYACCGQPLRCLSKLIPNNLLDEPVSCDRVAGASVEDVWRRPARRRRSLKTEERVMEARHWPVRGSVGVGRRERALAHGSGIKADALRPT